MGILPQEAAHTKDVMERPLKQAGMRAHVSHQRAISRLPRRTDMTSTNIIEFAPALQRRRERQGDSSAPADGRGSWDDHYPAGIDGLRTAEPQAMGVVIPLVRH
jgi:hypothetical protein